MTTQLRSRLAGWGRELRSHPSMALSGGAVAPSVQKMRTDRPVGVGKSPPQPAPLFDEEFPLTQFLQLPIDGGADGLGVGQVGGGHQLLLRERRRQAPYGLADADRVLPPEHGVTSAL